MKDYVKSEYHKILYKSATKDEYKNSINFLSKCLEQHFGEKVVILIYEYDVPLKKTYFRGYYEEMIELIRSMLNTALKTNTSLHLQ
jgi:hypothetical protein